MKKKIALALAATMAFATAVVPAAVTVQAAAPSVSVVPYYTTSKVSGSPGNYTITTPANGQSGAGSSGKNNLSQWIFVDFSEYYYDKDANGDFFHIIFNNETKKNGANDLIQKLWVDDTSTAATGDMIVDKNIANILDDDTALSTGTKDDPNDDAEQDDIFNTAKLRSYFGSAYRPSREITKMVPWTYEEVSTYGDNITYKITLEDTRWLDQGSWIMIPLNYQVEEEKVAQATIDATQWEAFTNPNPNYAPQTLNLTVKPYAKSDGKVSASIEGAFMLSKDYHAPLQTLKIAEDTNYGFDSYSRIEVVVDKATGWYFDTNGVAIQSTPKYITDGGVKVTSQKGYIVRDDGKTDVQSYENWILDGDNKWYIGKNNPTVNTSTVSRGTNKPIVEYDNNDAYRSKFILNFVDSADTNPSGIYSSGRFIDTDRRFIKSGNLRDILEISGLQLTSDPTNNNRATEVQAVINFYKADQDELNAGSIAAESIVASQTITVPLIKSYNDEDLKPRVSAHSQNTTTIIDSGQITDKSQPWAGVSIREAVASNALIYDGWRVNQYKGDYFGGRYIYFDVVDKDGNKLDDAKITDISVSGISNISTKWDWNANAFDAAGDTSNDSFQLNRDYSLQAGLHNHDWALFNMRDAEDSNNTFDQSKLAEVSLSFKITSQANYEGDVYVKVSDNTMGTWYENTYYNGNQFVLGEHVVYVGKAEKPAVVEVKDVNVDSTYKTIKIPEITITERVPGEFLSGSYDTTRTATGKDQRSIQIIVTEHGTGAPSPFVYFGSLANVKVEVVNSDSTTLELGKEKLDEPWNYNYMKSSGWSNYGGYITASALDIPVNKSSNAAMNTKKEKATIKISGLTIISDRAAVDGRYDIIVGGSAVADNYAQDDLDYGLAGLSNSLTKYPLPGGRLDTSPSTPSNPNPGNYGFYTEYRTYDKDLATFVTNTAGEGKFDTFGVIQELIDVNKAPITTDNNGGALAPTSHELILNVDTGSYTLDGAEGTMEMLPISEQGTTFAPFRAIGELLGFEVVWDGTDKIATLIDPVTNNAASFQIGSAEVTVTRGGTTFKRTMLNSAGEGYKTELKVPAGSQFGSTYIPLSQIAYAFGYDTENSSYSAETGLYTLAPKK